MSPQAGFVLQAQVIPRLKAAVPNVVHGVGAEDRNEFMQDSITIGKTPFEVLNQRVNVISDATKYGSQRNDSMPLLRPEV